MKMARVIEYENGKKYIRDVKTGRRREVTRRKRKEGEKKDEGNPKPIRASSEEKKKRWRGDLGWHCSPLRDQEVSKNYGLPDLQTALWMGNHARTMRWPMLLGHCPPHLARGSRGLCDKPVQGCKSMCHACEMGNGNAGGYSIGMKDLGGCGEIPLIN